MTTTTTTMEELLHQPRAPTLARLKQIFTPAVIDRLLTSLNKGAQQRNRVDLQDKLLRRFEECAHTMSVEDLLEAVGCCVAGTSPFNAFCEMNHIYDLYTAEYIDGLLDVISTQVVATTTSLSHKKTPTTILEIACGSGRLTQLLDNRAGTKSSQLKFVASDDGSWRIPRQFSRVDKVDYQAALHKYKPDIVICAWMPLGVDFTRAIRACPSVRMYILIGPKDDGTCGDTWATWGHQHRTKAGKAATAGEEAPQLSSSTQIINHPLATRSAELDARFVGWPVDVFDWMAGGARRQQQTALSSPIVRVPTSLSLPPYEADGFSRRDVTHLAQLCRCDTFIESGTSSTVVFERQK
jgi:hypothetical protein